VCLEAYLRQACVIPLERWWIARGADTLAPFRQLTLGVCYTRRESGWAGGDGGEAPSAACAWRFSAAPRPGRAARARARARAPAGGACSLYQTSLVQFWSGDPARYNS